jgi:predicted Abi (CAAX) family protease
MTVLWRYLLANPLAGLREFPRRPLRRVWVAVFLYSCWATAVGFGSGLLELELVGSRLWWILPVSLLVFPSFLEEFVFRGILIARTITDRGAVWTWLAIGLSTVLFVLWHPFNGAFLLRREASDISYDPSFLLIVAALGVTCGYCYAVTRCLWVAVLIHWATVMVWVFFLGGRNLLLEL